MSSEMENPFRIPCQTASGDEKAMPDVTHERIEARMKELGLSPNFVAVEAGLDRSTLRKYLNSPEATMQQKNLRKIADVLKCDVAYLIGEQQDPDPSNKHPPNDSKKFGRDAERRKAFAYKIKRSREALGLTQGEVASAIGVSRTAVAYWESAETEPSPGNTANLCEFLGLDLEYATDGRIRDEELRLISGGTARILIDRHPDMGNDNRDPADETVPWPPVPPRMVSLVGFVGAGSKVDNFEGGQGPFDEVIAPLDATEATVAVEVRGESLGSFFNGWLVYYDDVRRPITPDLINDLCVVGLSDGRILIKKVTRGTKKNLYHLFGQFEEPIYDAKIEWAAKIKQMSARR